MVLGATASGKTRLACELAYHLNGEIISADSRQVYQHLNIGTGKDLNEYLVNGRHINYHLIDSVAPHEQFYLHQFIEKLGAAFDLITANKKIPIICGGTGLYLDALRKDFSFTQIPENVELRNSLSSLAKDDLIKRLEIYPNDLTKHIDQNSKKRLIRGIEIAEYLSRHNTLPGKRECRYRPYYIGIKTDITTRKELIALRLAKRLDDGLIEEVKGLLALGITEERLHFFGLEYKFVLSYLQQKISREELYTRLETAIYQFAKRQMTWFRKMEKEGVKIHWIERANPITDLLKFFRQ